MARFRIDPTRSRLRAQARSSVHPIDVDTTGLEGMVEAEVSGDRLDLTKPVHATIEIAADRLRTRNVLYDAELARRLEVKRYPTIRGEVRNVTLVDAGRGRYRVRGELAFHGVRRELEGEVAIELGSGGLDAAGAQVIDMRDFGLEPPHLLMLRVYPEVRVSAHVVATREG